MYPVELILVKIEKFNSVRKLRVMINTTAFPSWVSMYKNLNTQYKGNKTTDNGEFWVLKEP